MNKWGRAETRVTSEVSSKSGKGSSQVRNYPPKLRGKLIAKLRPEANAISAASLAGSLGGNFDVPQGPACLAGNARLVGRVAVPDHKQSSRFGLVTLIPILAPVSNFSISFCCFPANTAITSSNDIIDIPSATFDNIIIKASATTSTLYLLHNNLLST